MQLLRQDTQQGQQIGRIARLSLDELAEPADAVGGEETGTVVLPEVRTVEAATVCELNARAFLAEGAIQCGYCTPGMVLSAVALLHKNPRPTDEQILEWMDPNVCRCCGYPKILAAVRRAASYSPR